MNDRPENQDLAGVGSMAVGAWWTHKQIQGDDSLPGIKEAWNAFRGDKESLIDSLPKSKTSTAYRDYVSEANLHSDLRNAAKRVANGKALSPDSMGYEGNTSAVKRAMREVYTSPRYRSKIEDIKGVGIDEHFNALSLELDKADSPAKLKTIVTRETNILNKHLPDFEDALGGAILRRTDKKIGKNLTYEANKNLLETLNFGELPQAGKGLRSKSITASQAKAVDSGKGYKKLQQFVQTMFDQGAINQSPGEYLSKLSKDEAFYESKRGFAGVNLRVGGQTIQFPLQQATTTMVGEVFDVTEYGVGGSSQLSFPRFMSLDQDGKIIRNAAGKAKLVGGNQALFEGSDPLILKAVAEADKTNQQLHDVLVMGIDETVNPKSGFQYGQNISGNATEITTLLRDRSRVAIVGHKEHIKNVGNPIDFWKGIEEQLLEGGETPYAIDTPSGVGKKAAFHMRPGDNKQSMIDFLSNPEGVNQGRRPLQGLSRPWEISDTSELAKKYGINLPNAGSVYDPANHSAFTSLHHEIANDGTRLGFSAPAYHGFKPGDGRGALGLGEGAAAYRRGTGVKFKRESQGMSLALPTESTPTKINPKYNRILSEIMRGGAERKEELIAGFNKSETFTAGEMIGDKRDPAAGLVDSTLDMKGTGRIRLHYVILKEGEEARFIFQMESKIDGPTKMFSTYFKSMLDSYTGDDMNELLDDEGLSIFQKHRIVVAGDADKLGKYGIEAILGQQVSGLGETIYDAATERPVVASVSETTNTGVLTRGLINDDLMPSLRQVTRAYHSGDIGAKSVNVLSHMETKGEAAFDVMKQYLGPEIKEHGEASIKKSLGLIEVAKEAHGAVGPYGEKGQLGITSKRLGQVFGMHQAAQEANGGFLDAALRREAKTGGGSAFASHFGTSFSQDLIRGIRGSRGVVGQASIYLRDSTELTGNTLAKIERRGFEPLLNNAIGLYPDLPDTKVNVADAIRSSLAQSVELEGADKLDGLTRIREAYQKPSKALSTIKVASEGSQVGATSASDLMRTGGYLDLSDVLPKDVMKTAGSSAFIPTRELMDTMNPGLMLGDEAMDQGYGREVQKLTQAADDFMQNASEKNRLKVARSFKALRSAEVKMEYEAIQKYTGGRMMNSIYEKVMPIKELEEVSAGAMTKYEGMGVGFSRSQVKNLFGKQLKLATNDDEVKALNELMGKVMKGDHAFPVLLQRNPTISNTPMIVGAGFLDKNMQSNDAIRVGRRIIDNVDMSPMLAMATSADTDGDSMAAAMLRGRYGKELETMVNLKSGRAAIAKSLDEVIAKHNKLGKAFENTLDQRKKAAGEIEPGQKLDFTRFVTSQATLSGQEEIGSFSHEMGRFRFAIKQATSTGIMDKKVSQNLFTMAYALEQYGAVGYKHMSLKSTNKQVLDGLNRVMDSGAGMRTIPEELHSYLSKWFGAETVAEEVGTVADLKGMEHGIRFSSTKVGRAIYTVESSSAKKMGQKDVMRALEDLQIARNAGGIGSNTVAHTVESSSHTVAREGMDNGVSEMNAISRAAGRVKKAKAWKYAKPLMMGAALSAGIYAMFDRGYSSQALEAPMGKDGGPAMQTSLGMQAAIQGGDMLKGNTSPNRGAVQGFPHAPGAQLPNRNSIPDRTVINGSTGRINVQGVIPDNINVEQAVHSMRNSVPYSQVGVNVQHNYNTPRDLGHHL